VRSGLRVYSYAIVSLSNTAIRESALCEPNGIDGGNPLCLAGWVYGSYRKGHGSHLRVSDWTASDRQVGGGRAS
jgi:hypothetical protein